MPRKAKLKREGDRVTVTCEDDRTLSWQRKCVGTQWEGELGTCPGSYATGAAVNMPPAPLPIGKLVMINDFPTLLLHRVSKKQAKLFLL